MALVDRGGKRHFHLRPDTSLGRWSVVLLGALAAAFVLTAGLVALGVRGFWIPAVFPGSIVFAAGFTALVTGLAALLSRHERALSVILAVVIGCLVALFLVGELAGGG